MSNKPTEIIDNLLENFQLEGDPRDWEANLNMRNWVQGALEKKGAKCTGTGFGACQSDLDIELDGMRYNIRIRSLSSRNFSNGG